MEYSFDMTSFLSTRKWRHSVCLKHRLSLDGRMKQSKLYIFFIVGKWNSQSVFDLNTNCTIRNRHKCSHGAALIYCMYMLLSPSPTHAFPQSKDKVQTGLVIAVLPRLNKAPLIAKRTSSPIRHVYLKRPVVIAAQTSVEWAAITHLRLSAVGVFVYGAGSKCKPRTSWRGWFSKWLRIDLRTSHCPGLD